MIIPLHNEVENITLLLPEVHKTLRDNQLLYEIICVDGGSHDGTSRKLREMCGYDQHLVMVALRRNFGQTAALQAGIDVARGGVIVFLDGDMENDPADIPKLISELKAGYDLATGWRSERQDHVLFNQLPSRLANWLVRTTTQVPVRDPGCTLKAIRSSFASELKLHGEMQRFIPAIAYWSGARIKDVEVSHRVRSHGHSKNGFGHAFQLILDLLVVLFVLRQGVRPMRTLGLAGLLSGGIGCSLCSIIFVRGLVTSTAFAGHPLFILGILAIMIGVQLVSTGLVAELLTRTYSSTLGRPSYRVRERVVGRDISEQA